MEGSRSVAGLLYGSLVFALVELERFAASGNSTRLPSGLVSPYAEGKYSSTPSISHPTMTYKLENYLRTYRKKSGLTQREVAFLPGCQNGAQVSRYEKRRRLPPLRTAWAYEAALGIPISQLFAGIYEEVSKEMSRFSGNGTARHTASVPKDFVSLQVFNPKTWGQRANKTARIPCKTRYRDPRKS